MDTLQAFCNDRGPTVNLSKTKLVVFQHRYVEAQPGLTYAGQPVEQVQSYKFLGLQMHGTKGLTFALSHLKAAAQRASFALLARCTELNITNIPLKLKLFDALVRPVMSYSYEVWAPSTSSAALMDLERVHVGFLRRLLGVPQSSLVQMIYAELGRLPCAAMLSGGNRRSCACPTYTIVIKTDWSKEPTVLIVCRRWAGGPVLKTSSTPWGSLLQLSTNPLTAL